jgi:hypothetical protein
MIAVHVSVVYQVDGLFTLVLAEQVGILILIASCDKSFQAQELEVISKVGEKVGDTRVITIT